ncbi:hypothetical protein VV869_12995 [Photobacterium sp. MCCC 1A19761]|uniref:hypothetical protein n=1 Tax=Photobacterium sp. MCCC 1A19761 TaxID=3115000 RepID=UPI00307EE13A
MQKIIKKSLNEIGEMSIYINVRRMSEECQNMTTGGKKMDKDWLDIAMVTGWISAWSVLVYFIPAVGV